MPVADPAPRDDSRQRPAPPLHGFLVIDKPAGWTSFDVVARARRLLGVRKIGHAGTLDPAATGVLPLAVGHATRVLEYLTVADKAYRAEVTFGVETDSHDRDGRVTATRDAASLTGEGIEAALTGFRGSIAQIPPMHAAIKVDGQRLYELARRGEEVERAPRPVVISRLALLAWAPPVATLLVECSKGTYVRALARDLGTVTGSGAYLSSLVRTRAGPFTLDEAITLDDLAAAELPAAWPKLAIPSDAVLADWPALTLDAAETIDWHHGKLIRREAMGDEPAPRRARVYDSSGHWIGIGLADEAGRSWRPAKVITHGR
ncbi:MAG: tRNA pseudouridine(55) synthase TruB [Chloroflexota bacterium]|nr:tRNA pseudouridine(55) synthase TruB [Chloroflexota bacterium]